HSLHAGSTAAAGGNLYGLYASGGAGTYVNNLVRLGIDKEGNAVARGTVRGIYHTSGTSGNNYWHNSVHVGGSAVEGSGTTAAFYSGATPTRNVRNNIFHNARTNGSGTGKHYGIYRSSATGWTSDYNLLPVPAGATGSFIGYSGSDQATLADWQSGSGQDLNSVIGDPRFVDATGDASSVDLHIDIAQGTPIEGMGEEIATVTHDFDNEERGTLTPVDIGADAGDFLWLEAMPPVIVYDPVPAPTCYDADAQTLVATITDEVGGSGMPTSGIALPVLYWTTDSGTTWNSATGSHVSGNDYSFMFGAGVPEGGTVQYYVAAQDSVGNVATNPAGGMDLTSGPPAAATVPTTLNSYTLPVMPT